MSFFTRIISSTRIILLPTVFSGTFIREQIDFFISLYEIDTLNRLYHETKLDLMLTTPLVIAGGNYKAKKSVSQRSSRQQSYSSILLQFVSKNSYLMQFYEINICQTMIFQRYAVYESTIMMIEIVDKTREKL